MASRVCTFGVRISGFGFRGSGSGVRGSSVTEERCRGVCGSSVLLVRGRARPGGRVQCNPWAGGCAEGVRGVVFGVSEIGDCTGAGWEGRPCPCAWGLGAVERGGGRQAETGRERERERERGREREREREREGGRPCPCPWGPYAGGLLFPLRTFPSPAIQKLTHWYHTPTMST